MITTDIVGHIYIIAILIGRRRKAIVYDCCGMVKFLFRIMISLFATISFGTDDWAKLICDKKMREQSKKQVQHRVRIMSGFYKLTDR